MQYHKQGAQSKLCAFPNTFVNLDLEQNLKKKVDSKLQEFFNFQAHAHVIQKK